MAKEKTKGKSVHVESETAPERDDLLTSLADELNKKDKDGGKSAFFLDDKEDPSTISDWITTGSSTLDLAICNRPHAGLPVGRMVELTGLEGTGKSMMAAHIIAATQKKGGKAIMIDTENSSAPEFWQSLGVDISKLLYIQKETVEDIFETIESAISYIRKKEKDPLVTIVVDSVAAASTKAELESEHGKDGYATGKAIIISKAMRKITNMIGKQRVLIVYTNQLRQNLKAMAFSDPWVVSGGKALAYHCSVRVRLSSIGKLKKDDDVIGIKCKAEVKKTRFGPGCKSAQFDIYFDSGIADYASWLTVLKKKELVNQKGAYYTFKRTSGEELQFSSKEFVQFMHSNLELREEVYASICNAVIMEYKNPNSTIVEDVVCETEEGEESAGTDDDNG